MAHLVRVRTDAAWVNGPLVLPADFRSIDQSTFLALNGDAGGSWAPAGQIIVAPTTPAIPFGMWATSAWTISTVGALIRTPAGSGFRFTFGDNDYFVLYPGHTSAARNLRATGQDVASGGVDFVTDLTLVAAKANVVGGAHGLWPIRVHNGATLVRVTMTFTIVTHASLPLVYPKLRIIMVDAAGVVTPLMTAGADPNGFIYVPTAPNAGAYGGPSQTLVYTCDGAQIVDISKYSYFAEVVDETGGGAVIGNTVLDFNTNVGSIADTRPQ